jgi:hypothetical protein
VRTLAALVLLCAAGPAIAAPALRTRMMVQGDVLVVGSTLAQDCGSAPTPPGASALCTGVLDGDSGSDAYWRDGAADNTVSATSARTSADLPLPAGATVRYARLYWSATLDGASPDPTALLDRPGGFSAQVTADATSTAFTAGPLPILTYIAYQASAEVTAWVATYGAGAYRVSDVAGIGLDGALSEISYAGWTLVVIYERPGSPTRTVALHDGLDAVTRNTPVSLNAGGFSVPAGAAAQAKLGVWALSTRSAVSGDALRVNGTAVFTADNPADNFFNRSRTVLGAAVPSLVPAFSGGAGSQSGYDLDVVEVSGLVKSGDSALSVEVSTGDDAFWLGGVVLSLGASAPPDAGSAPPPPPPRDAAVAPVDTAGARPEGGAPGGPPPIDGGGVAPDAAALMAADAAAGELPPHVPEQIYVDADTGVDVRISVASAGDVAPARSTGYVAEGSGCRCHMDAAPREGTHFLSAVIAISVACVIRLRRPTRRRHWPHFSRGRP